MSAPLSAAIDLPTDVETTWAALSSPSWPAVLADHLSDGSAVVRAEPTPDGGAVLVTTRELPSGAPPPLQRFVPADGRVTQTDTWGPAVDGVRRGTWQVVLPGSPGQVDGDMTVEPTGTGSRWSVSGRVTVRVPLIGGKVEGMLAPLVERLVHRQGEVLRDALVTGEFDRPRWGLSGGAP